MKNLIKLIVINIISFIGGWIVAYFEKEYDLGVLSAIVIFTIIGAIIARLF